MEGKREARHRAGYERKPVEPGEFDVLDNEMAHPDARTRFAPCLAARNSAEDIPNTAAYG